MTPVGPATEAGAPVVQKGACSMCVGDESLDGGECAACGRDLYDGRGPGGAAALRDDIARARDSYQARHPVTVTATEAGAPAATAAPKNAAERLEYLVELALEAFKKPLSRPYGETIGESMAQAAQAWELEVAEAREEGREEGREMLSIAHARIAQLEQTVDRLGVELDDLHQRVQAASERHAIQSREQRETIAALAAQLVREMRRGGL